MGIPTERFVIKYRRRTAHNLDALLRQLDKEHKTYAEWQRDFYSPFYDVKSTIKLDIEIMHYDCMAREYNKDQKDDQIRIFKKYGYTLKEGDKHE